MCVTCILDKEVLFFEQGNGAFRTRYSLIMNKRFFLTASKERMNFDKEKLLFCKRKKARRRAELLSVAILCIDRFVSTLFTASRLQPRER